MSEYTDLHKRIRALELAFPSGSYGTPSPTPNTLMKRDANARAQIAAPSVAADIARKDNVDAVQTNLNTHADLQTAGVHGSASTATANKLMHRDASGRAQIAAPSVAADIARKDTVDAVQTNLNTHANTQTSVHGSTSAATASKIVHRDASGRAQIATPSVAADIANKEYVDTVSGGTQPLLHVQDQKAANTAGGTFTSGAWQTRVLNTVLTNEIAGASLAANQITLPAGTYEIYAFGSAYYCARHKAKLWNVTGATDLLIGSSERSDNAGNGAPTSSWVTGRFTLGVQSVLELRHQCEVTRLTNGFGLASNYAVVEVYADVQIRKVA